MIDKELIAYASQARQRYMSYLDEEKAKKENEEKSRKRKEHNIRDK